MLEILVVETFFLDLSTLIHCFHCAKNATPLSNAVELAEHGFLHQVCEFFDNERTLQGVLIFCETQLPVNDKLDCHRSSHRFLGGGRDGFIVGIGVQRIAVVVDGIQRLQRGTNVVEVDFLCVQ